LVDEVVRERNVRGCEGDGHAPVEGPKFLFDPGHLHGGRIFASLATDYHFILYEFETAT
jgi:hypothetical protein